jgi:hypothetical protein
MSTAGSETASARVTIRVGPRTFARLRRAAEADRRPVSALARLLLIDALRDREREGFHGQEHDRTAQGRGHERPRG